MTFAFFAVYQVLVLPFCYFKIVGHKFALMIKAPQGHGSRTTLDRFGHALLFIIFGPVLLSLNCVVDLFWFLIHLYKMDLEVSSKKMQDSDTIDINRRTYKKMLKYFAQKNEQLVQQKRVAEDLRQYLDVMEGVKCLVYGRPQMIA